MLSIEEYIYYCRSRQLRPRTMQSYEQALRLFERWCADSEQITEPGQVREQTGRHYICDLQERSKFTFHVIEERRYTNFPDRRRDYRQTVSNTTINNYIDYPDTIRQYLRSLRDYMGMGTDRTSTVMYLTHGISG